MADCPYRVAALADQVPVGRAMRNVDAHFGAQSLRPPKNDGQDLAGLENALRHVPHPALDGQAYGLDLGVGFQGSRLDLLYMRRRTRLHVQHSR
jgi:hypothetical protein